MSGLSPQQKRFATEYLIDRNATQAAIRAGYSAASAPQQGSRLLKNAHVRRLVDQVQQEAVEAAAERVELSVETLLRDLEDTKRAAMRDGQYAAAIRAIELQGKALQQSNPFMDQPQKHQLVDEDQQPVSLQDIGRRIAFAFARAEADPGASAPPPTKH